MDSETSGARGERPRVIPRLFAAGTQRRRSVRGRFRPRVGCAGRKAPAFGSQSPIRGENAVMPHQLILARLRLGISLHGAHGFAIRPRLQPPGVLFAAIPSPRIVCAHLHYDNYNRRGIAPQPVPGRKNYSKFY